MKALLFVVLLALAVNAKKLGPITYRLCEGFVGPVKVDMDETWFKPNPPVEGQDFTFHVEGEMEKEVTFSVICVDAKAGLFHLDRCFDLHHPETLPKGHFEEEKTKTTPAIPWYVPKGNYKGKVIAKNSEGEELACGEGEVSVIKGQNLIHFDFSDKCKDSIEYLHDSVSYLVFGIMAGNGWGHAFHAVWYIIQSIGFMTYTCFF
jgi:hypothetical protein